MICPSRSGRIVADVKGGGRGRGWGLGRMIFGVGFVGVFRVGIGDGWMVHGVEKERGLRNRNGKFTA